MTLSNPFPTAHRSTSLENTALNRLNTLKEGGLTDAAKLIWVISHVYDAGMTLYTLRNRFMIF